MTTIRAALLGAAIAIGSVATAGAADLYGGRGGSIKDGYAPSAPAYSPLGFYLRGDVTRSWNDVGDITEPPNYTLTETRIDNNWGFGVGAGYHFSSHVRGDVTFDWGRTHGIRGSVADPAATFTGERRFGVKSDVVLANLYYDFGHSGHFTPYIGIGVGAARNTTSRGTIITTCGCQGDFEGATEWSAAGALMAGFSWQIKDRITLDAGYRFVYMGDAHTGDIKGSTTTGGVTTPQVTPDPKVADLYAHQLRVGVRFDIK